MYKINIIRSDSVYKNILKAPLKDRDSIFTKEILVPFKKKFEVQQMPIYNDAKQTMSDSIFKCLSNSTQRTG